MVFLYVNGSDDGGSWRQTDSLIFNNGVVTDTAVAASCGTETTIIPGGTGCQQHFFDKDVYTHCNRKPGVSNLELRAQTQHSVGEEREMCCRCIPALLKVVFGALLGVLQLVLETHIPG